MEAGPDTEGPTCLSGAESVQKTGFISSNLVATTVVWLANAAAVAALGVAGAYWTWTWFAPRPEPRAQAPLPGVARLDAAYPLFGKVHANRSVARPTAVAIRLLGVIAASGAEPGYALLQLGRQAAVAVREGGEVEPGTRVAEVHPDHVVLDRGGMRETLALPARSKGAAKKARHAG
jgi:general secretion pathway protein C